MEGPCADSVEKREPASDLAIVVVDSLKRLTPTGRLEKRTQAAQQISGLATIRLASRRAKGQAVATAVASAKPACAQQGVMLCAVAAPVMIAT